eukprot:7712492-Pyramimonas_sp.AAC.1
MVRGPWMAGSKSQIPYRTEHKYLMVEMVAYELLGGRRAPDLAGRRRCGAVRDNFQEGPVYNSGTFT